MESKSPCDKIPCKILKQPVNSTFNFPKDIKQSLDEYLDTTRSKTSRSLNRKKVEEYLVEQASCSKINPKVFSSYSTRLSSLANEDKSLIDILSTEESLQQKIHGNISCVISAITEESESEWDAPVKKEKIHNWLRGLKQIGQKSIEGYALQASFTENNDLFVIKSPRNPRHDELVHEAVVGMYTMNKLRTKLPNFMYVYGYTKCSPPVVKNKQVLTWCASSNPEMSYLITEKIRDSVPIGNWIVNPEVSILDFIAVFYQIVNALNFAYKHSGYTHYDLHSGNVMVRKFDKMVSVPYYGTSSKIVGYITTQYIPYIIDYGYSRVVIGGYPFYKLGLESAGTNEKAFPMHDIYKLICFLGEDIYSKPTIDKNKEKVLENLYFFFGEAILLRDRVALRFKAAAKSDYYSANENYRDIPHDKFINWLESSSGIPNIVWPKEKLSYLLKNGHITAPVGTSMDTCEFYAKVASKNRFRNSLEFCEVINAINNDETLSNNQKEESLDWVNKQFDSEKYFKETLPSVKLQFSGVSTITTKNNLNVNIRELVPGDILLISPAFIDNYQKKIYALFQIKEAINNISTYIRMNKCSLLYQNKYLLYRDQIHKLTQDLVPVSQMYMKQKAILNKNVAFVKKIDWKNVVIDTKSFNFWTKEHENLVLSV